ncbi:2-phosphosulfolactate phosphatase [Streptomyces sp. NPDC056161]|uniref:2-phosphosulfolactate phosphatase n=1 Tax=Streptomyces sp. NPDC056161 TaxID=3345732 RepID=UPI0035D8D1AB
MRPHYTGIPRPPRTDAPRLRTPPEAAVVVDVMRAFTVAAWAFRRGAEKIVFAATRAEALALKRRRPDWLAVQDGAPMPGFDLVNSPALLRDLDLGGRTLVQRTTSGTAGALAMADARLLLCASFVVAEATADVLRRARPATVTFVVTGDDGLAAEDLACAQYIAARAACGVTPAGPYLDRARRSAGAERLADAVRRGLPGVHTDDAELCLAADAFPFAMAAAREDGHLVLRPTRNPLPR